MSNKHSYCVPVKYWTEKAGIIYGAKPDETGPIGGGAGYKRSVTKGDYYVRTVEELLAAVAQAKSNETIFIGGGVELDFTDRVITDKLALQIPAGVTLAGDRGHDGSVGALLYSDAFDTPHLIETAGPGVRITGLRLRGPDPKRRLDYHDRVFFQPLPGVSSPAERNTFFYRFPNSSAICTAHSRLEVDNCEISAWSADGVSLRSGSGLHIHHNYIHHCQRMGLGYGVQVGRATDVLIEYNLFQDNKHHIAAGGWPGTGYEAGHNVVLPYTESHAHPRTGQPYGQDHLFDAHGGGDRTDGSNIACKWLKIHHNTFLSDYVAVNIRGMPEDYAEIHHNWFRQPMTGEATVISEGRTRVWDNLYGWPVGQLKPLRGSLELITPVELGSDAHPGVVRLHVHNISPLDFVGMVYPALMPPWSGSVQDHKGALVKLAAGGKAAYDLTVACYEDERPRGQVKIMLRPDTGEPVRTTDGLSFPEVNIPIVGRVIEAVPRHCLDAVKERAASSAKLPFLLQSYEKTDEKKIARAMFWITGDSLALAAEVYDREVCRDPVVWKTSCVEVFGSRALSDTLVQLFLTPALDNMKAEAFLPKDDGYESVPEVEVQSETSAKGDFYRLYALIPLEVLGLSSGLKDMLLEIQASAVVMPGQTRAYARLFGAEMPFKSNKGYGHLTIVRKATQ
ncbi:MAG: right-handed parallel beta-helix repeat-containing protein [Lentisphaerae bacterium]|nr:right-handed parallel beta-helix repeat-containing protein [Lentisphaerota bacterium]